MIFQTHNWPSDWVWYPLIDISDKRNSIWNYSINIISIITQLSSDYIIILPQFNSTCVSIFYSSSWLHSRTTGLQKSCFPISCTFCCVAGYSSSQYESRGRCVTSQLSTTFLYLTLKFYFHSCAKCWRHCVTCEQRLSEYNDVFSYQHELRTFVSKTGIIIIMLVLFRWALVRLSEN